MQFLLQMTGVAVDLTLVFLVEFINSSWKTTFPELKSKNLTLGNIQKSKEQKGVRDDILTAVTQFFIVNYSYCVQPTDLTLNSLRQNILEHDKCSVKLDTLKANGDSVDDDYTCGKCKEKDLIIDRKKKEIEKLRAQVGDLNSKLSDQTDTRLNSLNISHSIPWVILSLMSFIKLIPHRTVHSLMVLLKSSCINLSNIKIPSPTWIYSMRWALNYIRKIQLRRFIHSSKDLRMLIDSTSYKNMDYHSIVIINENGKRMLVDMAWLTCKTAAGGFKKTIEMLGDSKDLIYSKLIAICTDTASCQLSINKKIIQDVWRSTGRKVHHLKCMMHFMANVESYIMEIVDKKSKALLDAFTFCFGEPSGHSNENCKTVFFEWLSAKLDKELEDPENELITTQSDIKRVKEELKVEPSLGTRWSDSFRNAGVLYKYHLYILEFCTEAISGTKHNNNAKLKLIADALEKKTDYHRGMLGLISILWIYIMKPAWTMFAKGSQLSTVKDNLVKLRDIIDGLKTTKEPYRYITSVRFGTENVSGINESVSNDFVNIYLPSTTELAPTTSLIPSIAERILTKIDKDWNEFLMEEHEQHELDYNVKVTNQDVESSFSYLKNSKIDGNTTVEVRILRAICSFNKVLEWLLEQQDHLDIIEQATTKNNREETRRKSSDALKEHRKAMAELDLQPAPPARAVAEPRRKRKRTKN